MDILETGDLILFEGKAPVSKCIEFFTKSKFSHIGMVLKDPTFINPELKGYYLWESGGESFPEVESHKIFYGVQIVPLEKVLESCKKEKLYYMKLILSKTLDINKLKEIHHEIHHHKYDLNIIDWITAGIYQEEKIIKSKKRQKIETPKEVWCSALIGYIFIKMGWFSDNVLFRYLSPEDWRYKYDKKMCYKNCYLEPEKNLKDII